MGLIPAPIRISFRSENASLAIPSTGIGNYVEVLIILVLLGIMLSLTKTG